MKGPKFCVIAGPSIRRIIGAELNACVEVVERAYLAHAAGNSINPPSVFLRFDDRLNCRIIALPAHLKSPWNTSGLKWISSYPDNVAKELPRASAVLVLNEHENGFPFVCLEGSIISAARTAASAVLAARCLMGRRDIATLGVVGSGFIAGYVYRFLVGTGCKIDHIRLYDSNRSAAERFASRIQRESRHESIHVDSALTTTVSSSELIVFATVAARPHISDLALFRHNPVVLHISLRDVAPEILLQSYNVVDDKEHVLQANTSVHLAQKLSNSTGFISATLADVMRQPSIVDRSRPTIFSPFGLGILDVAVGKWVYERALGCGAYVPIDNFFPESELIPGWFSE